MESVSSKLLDMVDTGELDARTVLLAALKYMSEDDVADMARCNEFITEEEPSEDLDNLLDRDHDPEYFDSLRINS